MKPTTDIGKKKNNREGAGAITTSECVYIAEGVQRLYLSLGACRALQLVPQDFPRSAIRISALTAPASLKTSAHPLSPPYELVEENVGRLEKWLLEEFGRTVFATEHTPLPEMRSPPHHIHLRPGARPHEVHVPATVPHHFYDEVRRQLDDDIARGIIEEGRTLRDRERAMIQTSVNSSIRHDQQAHSLTPLRPGQRARIQNPSNGRWDRVGTVLERSAPRQYLLRLDGSGRVSIRNRRHLRPLSALTHEDTSVRHRSSHAQFDTHHPMMEGDGLSRTISKMVEKLNTEDLICEIEKLSALWDPSCEGYANKIEKQNCWNAIMVILIPDFEEKPLSEKKEIPLTGEPQLSDDSTESPTPVPVTTPRPHRTQRAPRHLDDYFLNSPV
ncbi:hypothetical protein O3P69_016466 [Scylla paramamosain]|uniref:Uncharacterized protein n=1 Tax=Scylla paramamosain TaxID=85552 RepID=A0AAW0TEH7_SCYPA